MPIFFLKKIPENYTQNSFFYDFLAYFFSGKISGKLHAEQFF